MKTFKKCLTAAFACILMGAMAFTSLAAADASITIINDSSQGEGTSTATYTAYRILEATYSENESTNSQDDKTISTTADGVAYFMPKDSKWKNAINALKYDSASGTGYFDVTETADQSGYVVTLNSNVTNSEATAKAIASYLSQHIPTGAESEALTINQAKAVEKGYYLIVSNLGTSLALVTTDVEIVEKNTYITLTKTANKTNMNVGDTVTYTITVSVPATEPVGSRIVVHDTIDATYLKIDQNSIAATFQGSPVTLVTVDPEAGETFARRFTVTEAMLGKDVVFTYNAELLSAAAADTGYVNSAYANDPRFTTAPVSVEVHTFDFDLDKNFQGVEDTDADAANFEATFELRTIANDPATAISFITTATGYEKADTTVPAASKDTVIRVTAPTNVNINGLAAGTYYLIETSTTSGYNLLTEPVTVVITDTTANDVVSHTVKVGSSDAAVSVVDITNNKGAILPTTGGMGTTMFYVVGSALVLFGGVALVAKKRMQKN